MDRRRFLATGTAVAAAVAGGCSLLDGGDRGVILTHVELGNMRGEPRTFHVLVLRNDDVVHWDQHRLEAGGDAVIEIDTPDEHASVDVLVRVDGRWKRRRMDTPDYDGKRVIATVAYGMSEPEALRIGRVVSDRPTAEDD